MNTFADDAFDILSDKKPDRGAADTVAAVEEAVSHNATMVPQR